MLADVGARLQSVLAELRRLPGILGVTIARRDGILIAHSLPKTMDPKKIAAMAAAIVGTSEMAAVEMGLGSCSQSIVDTHSGMMMATGAGEEAMLVAMSANGASMALIQTRVGRAGAPITAIARPQQPPAGPMSRPRSKRRSTSCRT